eukprot:5701017-Pyramimonas_sp.AAC.1
MLFVRRTLSKALVGNKKICKTWMNAMPQIWTRIILDDGVDDTIIVNTSPTIQYRQTDQYRDKGLLRAC